MGRKLKVFLGNDMTNDEAWHRFWAAADDVPEEM